MLGKDVAVDLLVAILEDDGLGAFPACGDVVRAIAPTYCVTEGKLTARAANPNRAEVVTHIPSTVNSRLGRVGGRDDSGRVVLFCASDMSMFMIGSTLKAGAGETI